jgi:hypothetical protein
MISTPALVVASNAICELSGDHVGSAPFLETS